MLPISSSKSVQSVLAFRGSSDGGVRDQSSWTLTGKAACGWVVEGGFVCNPSGVIQWTPLMYGRVYLGLGFNSFDAELSGVEGLVQGLCHLLGAPSLNGQVHAWFHDHLIP